jgi:hypothetical protein
MLARAFAQDLFAGSMIQLVDDAEGGIRYWPEFVSALVAQEWFQSLHDKAAWTHMRRPMYDRVVDVPRLLASYPLSNLPPELPLADMLARIQGRVPAPYNTVGLNLYRDGADSVAMHNSCAASRVADSSGNRGAMDGPSESQWARPSRPARISPASQILFRIMHIM